MGEIRGKPCVHLLCEPRCWRGILDKFWDTWKNKSKSKRQLKDGPERAIGVDFKESKSTTKK
jgi:hypothetical protein